VPLSAATALLLGYTNAQDITVPQISDYSVPSFAFTALSWMATWGSWANVKDGKFDAVDAAIGLYGTHAVDTENKIWLYATPEGEKKEVWTDLGVTGIKVIQPIMGGIIYVSEVGIVTYYGTLFDDLVNEFAGASSLVAVDVAAGLTAMAPSIIDSLGAVY